MGDPLLNNIAACDAIVRMTGSEAYQETHKDAAEVPHERGPGNDDGRQYQRSKGSQIHGDVAKAKDTEAGDPCRCQDSHPAAHTH